MNRQEILDGISTIRLDCQDFEQNFEGDQYSSAFCKKGVETENYNIDIEFKENVRWTDYEDYEMEDLEIVDIVIIDIHGNDYSDNFTEDELLNCINY
jgi:hypothetical protein